MSERKETRRELGTNSIKNLAVSQIQKGQLARRWIDKTLGEANRIFCVTMGGLIGMLLSIGIGATNVPPYTVILIAPGLITATAAIGHIVSYFTEGLLAHALTGISRNDFKRVLWLRDELAVEIKRIKRLPYLSKEDKQAIIIEVNAKFEVKVDQIMAGIKL
jgi:hypothetical protein